jgi:hypothetical protein
MTPDTKKWIEDEANKSCPISSRIPKTEYDDEDVNKAWQQGAEAMFERMEKKNQILVDALEKIKMWDWTTDGRKFDGNHKEVAKHLIEIATNALTQYSKQ